MISITDLLKDHQTGQDGTQIGSFVLGGRTPWGTYTQALRELYKRMRGLRGLVTERDLLMIDGEDLADAADGDPNDRDVRRAEIKLKQLFGRIEELDRNIRDTYREAGMFYVTAAKLRPQFGELTPEKRAVLDREEWRWWHIKRAAIAKLASGRIDEVVLKNLASLPIAERHEWLAVMKDDNALIAKLEGSEYGRPPAIFDVDASVHHAIAASVGAALANTKPGTYEPDPGREGGE